MNVYPNISKKKTLSWTAILGASLVAACSAYDFLSFREDTGLYVINRPDGYGTVLFGTHITATSTDKADFIAISAGQSHPTIFYKLSEDGKLVDPDDPWQEHLGDNDEKAELEGSGSGAALAGLPKWDGTREGCVAIGEPLQNQVTVKCEQSNLIMDITGPTDFQQFGSHLASVQPIRGGAWLLAGAGQYRTAVFSGDNGNQHSATLQATEPGGSRTGEVVTIAAGRVAANTSGRTCADGCAYVAVTTHNKSTGRRRVYVFAQSSPYARSFEQAGCIERSEDSGFAGSMATGDLDGDGDDELAVAAGYDTNRADKVYIYRPMDIIRDYDNGVSDGFCQGTGPAPVATAEPGQGPLDVECDQDCNFGATMTIGDISTDDSGCEELIVGLPGATVDGKKNAGAVFVYRWKDAADLDSGQAPMAGQVADSYAEREHRFGGGLAVAPMGGRNELIVGATGKGHIFIAFCTGVGTNLDDGGDVTDNANGSVVSTRCRL